MAEYWNHNSAYHPWLIPIAAQHCGDVLDVGCGEGLLAQRLTPVSRSVTGIDPDPSVVQRARDRLAAEPNVTVVQAGFDEYDPGAARFDLIVFVASLHHMDLRSSLRKARELLRPSGEIAVVGRVPACGAYRFLAARRDPRHRRAGRGCAREPGGDPLGRRRRPSRCGCAPRVVLPISTALARSVG